VKGQLDFISETEFEYTDVGVFISFDQEPGIEEFKASKADLILHGVSIHSPELEIGADSTLFFKNGLIDHLELWSFGGGYPQHQLRQYELRQAWDNSPQRKIERRG